MPKVGGASELLCVQFVVEPTCATEKIVLMRFFLIRLNMMPKPVHMNNSGSSVLVLLLSTISNVSGVITAFILQFPPIEGSTPAVGTDNPTVSPSFERSLLD